jgi:ATP-dependent HslUV protease subunit HslV
MEKWHGTTILSLRDQNQVVVVGDGQVSMGPLVVKSNTRKVRTLCGGKILVGFAGATADAFTLLEKLEEKLGQHGTPLMRACVQLAKEWRTDRYLRKLEAMIVAADVHHSLLLTGNGDVLEPEDNIVGIGSGGAYALSAARALKNHTSLSAVEIAQKSMEIAAQLCVYTNTSIIIETLSLKSIH